LLIHIIRIYHDARSTNFIIHYLTAHQITSYFTDLCNMHVTYINIILQSRSTFLVIR